MEVKHALANLQELVQCRCHEAFKDRGLHDPECNCDYVEEVETVISYIDDLEGEVLAVITERDAVIARLVEAAENADGYDRDCGCDSCMGITPVTWESLLPSPLQKG